MAKIAAALIVLLAAGAYAKNVTETTKKQCPPKLTKGVMLQRSTMARAMAAAKTPDPTCKTGVVSLAGAVADRPQACCPAYCGECSDYPQCDKVRGQDSANACCLTKVLDLQCGGAAKPAANVCLKGCDEATPPCIMAEGKTWEKPAVTSAAEDCNEAVGEWMGKAESAVKAAKGGAASWDALKKAGTILNFAHGNETTVVALDKDMKTQMLVQMTKQTDIHDPCAAMECPALRCPGGFTEEKVAGHCCGYCVNPNIVVEHAAKGASGEFGGKPSTFCNDVWCFPTLCTKGESNPNSSNGQCCPTCPAL